ncbi:MAG: o-succinylbenzoate synthase, partial [Puniceicoccales bacterium]|nr:o-succinylbenzoate synthase [Puniceicoccales bacterium]
MVYPRDAGCEKVTVGLRIAWVPYRRRYRRPLRTGSGVFCERAGIVLRVEDATGAVGFGEIAPWSGFGGETLNAAESFLNAALATLRVRGWTALEGEGLRELPCTRAAFFMARQSLEKQRIGAVAAAPFRLRSAALLPSDAGIEALSIARADGFTTFKCKIGGDGTDDIRRVETLLGDLRTGERLRLDANGTLAALAPWLPLLADERVEFLEQPYSPERMATEDFSALAPVLLRKLALDESITNAATLPENWPGVVVIKPLQLGDWAAFRRWRETHPATPVIYSSSFETSIGREALLRLAAADALASQWAHGFDTPRFFEDDGWNAHATGAFAAPLDWTPAEWDAWWHERTVTHRKTVRTFLLEKLFPADAAARAIAAFDGTDAQLAAGAVAIGAVVVTHTDPASYLGAVLAALAAGKTVFCANPHWGKNEWHESGLTPPSIGAVGLLAASLPEKNTLCIPTGGTGGRVRFVAHTVATLTAAARAQLAALGAANGATLDAVSPLPPWHISGIMPLVRAWVGGGSLVLCDGGFSPTQAFPALPTSPMGVAVRRQISLVPTQLRRLLERTGGAAWLRQFDCVLLGGA